MTPNLTYTRLPPSNKEGLYDDVWLRTFQAVKILRKYWQVHEILMERNCKEMFRLCLEDSKDIFVMSK